MRYRGRKWNNILMLCVVAFIGVLNLPAIIKTYLIEPEESTYPYLLNPSIELQSMHFSAFSIEQSNNEWKIVPESMRLPVTGSELIERWENVVGTEVDEKTYRTLSDKLGNPQTVEVWYQEQEEPHRVTYYQLPDFWLLKNWQGKWIAISVEADYLSPNALSLN
ncbi:hypothetical protein [Vibrio sp. 99-70-13A1]|uniref:hypothetical protein n=1 Tax=Vibrio sp. 99-70-13A1 TaxID=2607601 RepID=UPI001493C89F|nr:hypothetical protein [Vibrio sp. 99-70-13A1]NOH96111.1 hypothetical protein [Vibrio sp. 99-70-13A1]